MLAFIPKIRSFSLPVSYFSNEQSWNVFRYWSYTDIMMLRRCKVNTLPLLGVQSIAMNVSLCLFVCVCLSVCLQTTGPHFMKLSAHVNCGGG